MSRDIELINILVKTRLHKVKPFSKYATLNIREQKFPLGGKRVKWFILKEKIIYIEWMANR